MMYCFSRLIFQPSGRWLKTSAVKVMLLFQLLQKSLSKKNSEVFRGSSSSLEALTCFISFRAVTRHFWWRPASFLLRNPIPIPLVPDILTYGRFPSISNPLTRKYCITSLNDFWRLSGAFESISSNPFLGKIPRILVPCTKNQVLRI